MTCTKVTFPPLLAKQYPALAWIVPERVEAGKTPSAEADRWVQVDLLFASRAVGLRSNQRLGWMLIASSLLIAGAVLRRGGGEPWTLALFGAAALAFLYGVLAKR